MVEKVSRLGYEGCESCCEVGVLVIVRAMVYIARTF